MVYILLQNISCKYYVGLFLARFPPNYFRVRPAWTHSASMHVQVNRFLCMEHQRWVTWSRASRGQVGRGRQIMGAKARNKHRQRRSQLNNDCTAIYPPGINVSIMRAVSRATKGAIRGAIPVPQPPGYGRSMARRHASRVDVQMK